MQVKMIQWVLMHGKIIYIGKDKIKKILKRINQLVKDIHKNPFDGIGKPEPLKNNLSGFWSRRIDEEHRLVYIADNDVISIISCKGHYNS